MKGQPDLVDDIRAFIADNGEIRSSNDGLMPEELIPLLVRIETGIRRGLSQKEFLKAAGPEAKYLLKKSATALDDYEAWLSALVARDRVFFEKRGVMKAWRQQDWRRFYLRCYRLEGSQRYYRAELIHMMAGALDERDFTFFRDLSYELKTLPRDLTQFRNSTLEGFLIKHYGTPFRDNPPLYRLTDEQILNCFMKKYPGQESATLSKIRDTRRRLKFAKVQLHNR